LSYLVNTWLFSDSDVSEEEMSQLISLLFKTSILEEEQKR